MDRGGRRILAFRNLLSLRRFGVDKTGVGVCACVWWVGVGVGVGVWVWVWVWVCGVWVWVWVCGCGCGCGCGCAYDHGPYFCQYPFLADAIVSFCCRHLVSTFFRGGA